MKKVTLYCDGSCLGNPGPGGWCAILLYGDKRKTLSGAELSTTNNRMEILSLLRGLEALLEPCEVAVFSDSQYVVNAINEWLRSWVSKNFKEVKNVELWQEYLALVGSRGHQVSAFWVKGHSGDALNEECDLIARSEAQRCKDLSECSDERALANLNASLF